MHAQISSAMVFNREGHANWTSGCGNCRGTTQVERRMVSPIDQAAFIAACICTQSSLVKAGGAYRLRARSRFVSISKANGPEGPLTNWA